MFSILTLIFNTSSLFSKLLETVPSVPTTSDITVTFMFYIFFWFLARSKYLSIFSFFFTLLFTVTVKSNCWLILFYLIIITRSGRVAGIRWSVCISKFQKLLCVSFLTTDFGLCIYYLVVWSNLNLLHDSQWTIYPTQVYQALLHLFVHINSINYSVTYYPFQF